MRVQVTHAGVGYSQSTASGVHQGDRLLTAIHVADWSVPPSHTGKSCGPSPNACGCTPASTRQLRASCRPALLVRLDVPPGRSPAPARPRHGRDDVVPGMVAAIQTFGELLHWHPHVHVLLTCGAFTPEGEFLQLPDSWTCRCA